MGPLSRFGDQLLVKKVHNYLSRHDDTIVFLGASKLRADKFRRPTTCLPSVMVVKRGYSSNSFCCVFQWFEQRSNGLFCGWNTVYQFLFVVEQLLKGSLLLLV